MSVDAIQVTEAEDDDLKWDLHGALLLDNKDRIKLPQPPNSVQLVRSLLLSTGMLIIYKVFLQVIPANSFRAAVIGYSAFAIREVALYISLDSTSLGIPLALTRVFKSRVCTLSAQCRNYYLTVKST